MDINISANSIITVGGQKKVAPHKMRHSYIFLVKMKEA